MSALPEAPAPNRPEFRGCVFCYSAEWAYYGTKKAVGKVAGDQE